MTTEAREKAAVVTVRVREQARPVVHTDAQAPVQAQPRQEKKKNQNPGKPTTEKKVTAAKPQGALGDIIADAREALKPAKVSTLAEMGARMRALKDDTALSIARTIEDLIAKAANGTSGTDVAEVLASVKTKLAGFKPSAVESAEELLSLRAKKKELDERDTAVKRQGAKYASLCGKCKRNPDDANLENEKAAMKSAIDAEKAAIAEERAKHGEDGKDLTFCEDIAMFRSDDVPPFEECLELVAERNRLAAEGPGLAESLAHAVAAYKARIAELGGAK